MGVVDLLGRARAEFERGDWRAAVLGWAEVEPDRMDADDLSAVATAAFLVGRRDTAVESLQRSFRLREDGDDRAGAVRCASTWR